jgi:hypothetical protein
MGTCDFFQGVKQPRLKLYHSHLSIVEVKNKRRYASTAPIRLNGVQKGDWTFLHEVLVESTYIAE